MSEQIDKQQTIIQYLLGALPEAEIERFDALSVSDDSFADNLAAAEKDLVDAYVQGELTGADLERFNSHYLSSPRRRESVSFARAFRIFAERNARAPAVDSSIEPSTSIAAPRERSSWLSALRGSAAPRLRWQWGMALAALVLLVAGGWLAFENAQLRRQMAQTQAQRDTSTQREQELQKELEDERSAGTKTAQELAQAHAERERLAQELQQRDAQESERASEQQQSKSSVGISIASFVLTPQVRGVEQIKTVNIPPQTDRVAVRLELEPNEYQTYRVALLDSASRQTLWRSGELKARSTGNDKSLGVSFRAALLQRQTYVLQVEGIDGTSATEIVGAYPFRVVK